MDTVVIGWNPEENIEKWDAFSKIMEKVFLSVKTDGFKTDSDHIKFAYTPEEIEDLMDNCSVLVCPEELSGVSIGNGTFKKWKEKDSTDVRIVTILDRSRKGGGKCAGLYENGIYDAIFRGDFNAKNLFTLINNPRSKSEAFVYYGLDEYRAEERKKAIKKAEATEQAENSGTGNLSDGNAGLSVDTAGSSADSVSADTLSEESGVKKKRKRKRKKKGNLSENVVETGEAVSGQPEDVMTVTGKGTEPVAEDMGHSDSEEPTAEPHTEPLEPSEDISRPEPLYDAGTVSEPGDYESGDAEPLSYGPYDGEITGPVEGGFMEGDAPYDAYPEPATEPSSYTSEPGDLETLADVFNAGEIELDKYLADAERLANSYLKPVHILSKIDTILEQLTQYYTIDNPVWLMNLENGTADRAEFEAELWQRIGQFADDLVPDEALEVFEKFSRFMWGYDIIEPFLLDEEITDIKIYEPQVILLTFLGENMAAPASFRSAMHYHAFVTRIAAKNHVNIQDNAIVRCTDITSYDDVRLRINISTELLNSSGQPLVHIRVTRNRKYTINELVRLKMMDKRTAAYLIQKVQEGASILICGENASGKTSLFNTLLEYLLLTVSGLVIQESDELFSTTHPFLQFQQIASDKEFMGNDTVGKKYTLAELARNGLLTKIDFFGIGEMKGEEAAYFGDACDTGSQCIGTTHTSKARHGLMRLVQLAKLSETKRDFSKEDLLRNFCSMNVVVFMKHFQVCEISEVIGFDEDKKDVIYKDIPVNVPEREERQKKVIRTYSFEGESLPEGEAVTG